MNKTKSWAAERMGFVRTYAMLVGKPVKIKTIPEGEDDIGYTSANGEIYLAYEHPIMNGLKDAEKRAFRKGVFCHEMLHQIFTNFDETERRMKRMSPGRKKIFGMLANVLEDPAIENWAPTVVGTHLVSALRFTIAHIYKNSSNIEEGTTPIAQFVNALIQFGDMGVIKGHFTFTDAKDCFRKAAPIFFKGIEEPDNVKRLDYAEQIMDIARPLWENEAEAVDQLAKMLAEAGKSRAMGKGSGADGDSSELSGDDSAKKRRRKITIEKVSKEEMEDLKKNGSASSGPIPEDADVTILVCEDDNEEKNGDGSSGAPSSSKDKESSDNENGNGSSSGDSSQDGAESGSKSSESSNASGKNSGSDNNSGKSEKSSDANSNSGDKADGKDSGNATEGNNASDADDAKNKANSNDYVDVTHRQTSGPDCKHTGSEGGGTSFEDAEVAKEEYELSQEDIEYILNEEKMLEEAYEEAEKANAEDDSDFAGDFAIDSPSLGHRSCINLHVKHDGDSAETIDSAYTKIVNKHSAGIRSATTQLKKIFEQDQEEREYRTSGRIHIKRANCGRVTSRIFDRRKAPADKSNLAIEILVDESGSMSANQKYNSAKECCIALAEIFGNLNIPIYVIGFTADTRCNGRNYDIVHNHYVTWKNARNERLKLLNISARANNCDGYSIRYATEVLKKHKAKNKLLIVISDGQPAAYSYSDGVADTKLAIKEAKRNVSVLGVAVGNNDTETIHYMYENDFLHISNASDLFSGLAHKVKNIIKGWD